MVSLNSFLMTNSTSKRWLLALCAAATLTAQAGDGTKASPLTPIEVQAQADALVAAGKSVFLTADLLGFGNSVSAPLAAAAERETSFIVGNAHYGLVARAGNHMAEGLNDADNKHDLLLEGVFKKSGDSLIFHVARLENALHLTVDATGYASFWAGGNWTIPNERELQVVSASASAKSKGDFTYKVLAANTTVVGAGSAGYILQGRPGTYAVVLVDKSENTGTGTTSLSAGVKGRSKAMKNRFAYKFVSTAERTGFVRGEGDGSTVMLDSPREVYTRLPEAAVSALLGTAATDLTFIPWKNKDHITGLTRLADEAPKAKGVFDLNGRRCDATRALPAGVYIIDGTKTLVK